MGNFRALPSSGEARAERLAFEESAAATAGACPVRHPSSPDGWDPCTYHAFVRDAFGSSYEELHEAVVAATRDLAVRSILDLGTGTGEAGRRLLAVHDDATFVGLDANQAMLRAAASSLPTDRATFVRQRLEEPLPQGPFDLVVSALAVHHLNAHGKRELFARVRDALAPNGRFVLADAVRDPLLPQPHRSVPGRLAYSLRQEGIAETARKLVRWLRRNLSTAYADYDEPDTVDDQIEWLAHAGLRSRLAWEGENLAIIVADKPGGDRDYRMG